MLRVTGLLILFAGVVFLGANRHAFLLHAARDRSGWAKVAPGVELLSLRVPGEDVPVTVIRTTASRIHVAGGDSLDAAGWRSHAGALAAVNGGFFDPGGKPLGLCVADSRRLARLRKVDQGVFFIREGKAQIMHAPDFARRKMGSVSQALECGPRLVVDGEITHLKTQWARRTGIGIQEDGRVVIAVADGSLSLPAWASLWRDTLHCRDALNFDGGPSSQLSVKTLHRSLEISGGWPVPDAIVVR